jgi:phospholipid transport system substrate-binding protein
MLTAAASVAGEPTEKIRETTDRFIAIISDPSLKGPENAEQKKILIRQAVDERFDWAEMSKRSLARHWSKRTEEEQQEFIRLFGMLLERTYMDKVQDYSGEKVLYDGESVDGKYAVVTVRIVTRKETEVSVKYRMKKKKDDWLVYDISIEGVSMINNYRKQFNSILVRSSYEDLIEKLKAKVEGDKS